MQVYSMPVHALWKLVVNSVLLKEANTVERRVFVRVMLSARMAGSGSQLLTWASAETDLV